VSVEQHCFWLLEILDLVEGVGVIGWLTVLVTLEARTPFDSCSSLSSFSAKVIWTSF